MEEQISRRNLHKMTTVVLLLTLTILHASTLASIQPESDSAPETLVDDNEHLPFVQYAVRLRGCGDAISVQAGRLEIYYKDEWGTVCNHNFSTADAHVACYSLGFTRYQGIALRESFGAGSGKILLAGLNCTGDEIALNQCRHPDWLQTSACTHDQDVSIACIDDTQTIVNGYPTRLVNTFDNNTLAGRLEIYYDGCWGTVCNDEFDDEDALVACRSINPRYRVGRMVLPSDLLFYGPGTGRIWLDTLHCDSDLDINIGYCAHRPWGVHDCNHDEDVAIICEYVGCDNQPCENGATCIDDPDNIYAFTCKCPEGYFGTYCESNRCENVTCENGGTCSLTGNLCRCAPFYRGEYCEIEIGGCESSPCLNGATCNEFGQNHTCTCNQYHTGQHCETVIGGCEDDKCQNNGTCVESGYNFTCVCEPAYTDPLCSRLVQGCEVPHCLNGATCIENGTLFTCQCDQWYYGVLCETEKNGCYDEPCVNGGTCHSAGRNFVCECPQEFTGTRCEGIIGGCNLNRCLNGATCIEQGPYYTCTCAIGFTGHHCETQRPQSACGNILHFKDITKLPNIPPYSNPEEGQYGEWSAMCYLGNSAQDREYWDTECYNLLQNIYYGNDLGLVRNDGDYGCWASNAIPNDNSMYHACKNSHDWTLKMSSNSTNVMMAICIRYVPWPMPETSKENYLLP